MKKFELTAKFKLVFGKKLFQIRALIDIEKYGVKAGDLGGWVEKEENLSHKGNAWVSGNAWVYGDAEVCGDAQVSGNAWVSGNAQVSGNAWVYGDAQVYGDAWVYGDAQVSGNAWVSGDAQVYGDAWVYGDAQVSGNAWVSGDAFLKSCADILYITGLGTVHRTTTAFRCENGEIKIVCGRFFGNLEAFKKQVISTRTGKVKDEYLKFAELIEIYFRGE